MRALTLFLAALLLACQSPVSSQTRPALEEWGPLERIAVAPFVAGGSEGAVVPPDAAAVVARRLAEALEVRGLSVVAPEDVRHLVDASAPPPPARVLARLVADRFGSHGLVTGRVYRFRKRTGEAAGTLQPAAVGFEVVLWGAPGGRELWRATFDETQKALTENLLSTPRYPGGGTRWLTAEELAAWGAREVAGSFPAGR